MGYPSDRERFFQWFGREFPKGTENDARALLRAASGEQRWNEVSCSFDIGETATAREEKRSEARMGRVRALCAALGAQLEENGDPRGYPFTITAPNGRSMGVPGRGLPARAFR